MQFRKRPVVIEAIQYLDAQDQTEIIEFGQGAVQLASVGRDEVLLIETLEGSLRISEGDWIIRGVKGEVYPCKPDVFASTYEATEGEAFCADHPATGFGIGEALRHLRNGCKVQRAGWNGKGMFIVLMPAMYLPPFNTQGTDRKVNDRTAKHIGEDTPLDCQPYLAMFTADKKWQPGWVCSQADLLANDWQVVD